MMWVDLFLGCFAIVLHMAEHAPEQVCVMPGALLAHHTPDGAVAWERGRDAVGRGIIRACR